MLASVAVPVATAPEVVRIFFETAAIYGFPASVLSDNGAIYTPPTGAATPAWRSNSPPSGSPSNTASPTTPKHREKSSATTSRSRSGWPRSPPAATLAELQAQIDRFVHIYNEERPHTARGCPPMQAWRALDKATVQVDGQPLLAHTKVRHDRIDSTGCFTLRYRSGFHHVSVGRAHKGKRVLILMADLDVRVFDDDGVMIRHIELDPSVNFQGRSRIII